MVAAAEAGADAEVDAKIQRALNKAQNSQNQNQSQNDVAATATTGLTNTETVSNVDWEAVRQKARARAVAALLRLPEGPAVSAEQSRQYQTQLVKEGLAPRSFSHHHHHKSTSKNSNSNSNSSASGKGGKNKTISNPAAAWVSPLADKKDLNKLLTGGGRAWCPYKILPGGRGAVVLTDSLSSAAAPQTLLAIIQRLAPPRRFRAVPTAVLICGFPNVGKSTIINALKRSAVVAGAYSDGYGLSGLGDVYLPASGTGGKARVGPQPGVTRHVQGFRVCEDPPVVVLDTPGVMAPHLEASPAGPAAAARLALAGCVADKAVEPDAMCAALLQELNSQGYFSYTRVFSLPDWLPTADVSTLYSAIARANKWRDGNVKPWHHIYTHALWGAPVTEPEARARFLRARVRLAQDRLRHGAAGAWADKLPRKTYSSSSISDCDLPPSQSMSESTPQSKPHHSASVPTAAAEAGWANRSHGTEVDWERVDPHLLPLTREEEKFDLSPDTERRAQALFLKKFREGVLGYVNLDYDVLIRDAKERYSSYNDNRDDMNYN